jgi:chromosome segregation ATPase
VSIAAWLGIGAGVLALVLTIQTLRLKSAKRDLKVARAAAENSNIARRAAEGRYSTERRIAQKWAGDYNRLHDSLKRNLAELQRQKETVERQRDEVRDAATDDVRLIAVLRGILGPVGTLPKSRPPDPDDGSDEPV